MDEQHEPDTDPTTARTDEAAEVEGHKIRRRPRLNDEMDDEPDVEGHLRAREPAQARARRR